MLKTVDSALDAEIPDEILAAENRIEASQIMWDRVIVQAQKIISVSRSTKDLHHADTCRIIIPNVKDE